MLFRISINYVDGAIFLQEKLTKEKILENLKYTDFSKIKSYRITQDIRKTKKK